MAASMNPEEVPAALVAKAREAWNAAPQKRNGEPTRMRHALAAALTKHELLIREQIAEQILARGRALRMDDEEPISRDEWSCYGDAASIARGER